MAIGAVESVGGVRPIQGRPGNAFALVENRSAHGPKFWSLIFDLPGEKVNKLNRRVLQDFEEILSRLEILGKEGQIEGLVLRSGKPGGFIAGADIEMLQAVKNFEEAESLSRSGQRLCNRWEDLPFPTVAAINGAALGGGFEFALASSAIVMSDDPQTKVGLPEVMLGLLPGSGGCIRLPVKVGFATALDLILTGKNLNGDRAYRTGLVEACLPRQNFEESVYTWFRKNLKALQEGRRIAKEPKLGGMGGIAGSLMEKTPPGKALIFKKARDGVLSKTRGHYPAPLEILDVIQSTGVGYGPKLRGAARDQAMKREAQGFGKLVTTEVSKNLIRLFFLTEGVKKSKGLPEGKTAVALPIRSGAVLGAGVMGGGIAQLFADQGIPARMKDLNPNALALGVQSASIIFKKQVKRKKLNQRQYLQKMNLISPVLDYSGFHSSDLVVEAIVENMEVKKKALQEAESQVRENCILASNTSSLSISKMQSVLKKPERFVGMHFFNPVHKMPLIEVIRGDQSSDEAVGTVFQLSKLLGKTPIVVKDGPGFLVNRLLAPYLNEATYCLAEGVPIPEIDEALLRFGMPMGPMELIDEVGVDVGEKVAHILNDAFGDRMKPAPFNGKVAASGRLGKKSGKGFYQYEKSSGRKEFDSEIYAILGVKPRPGALSYEQLIERCIYPMINEAARCLDECIVNSACDVDLGMIMGTGFPPFRGGLLRYADSLGARKIVEGLEKYRAQGGARFEPSPALLSRAKSGRSFYGE